MVYKGKPSQIIIYKKGKSEINQMDDIDVSKLTDLTVPVRDSSIHAFVPMPYGGIVGSDYDSDSFTVALGTTDYNVATNRTALWNSVPSAKYIRITSSTDITIKINSTTADGYAMKSTESPLEILLNGITNIFITTTGTAANVKVLLIG